MGKLTITIKLSDEEIATLLDTLRIGAAHRFAPTLQAGSLKIADYVQMRADDAIIARGRKRRAKELAQ